MPHSPTFPAVEDPTEQRLPTGSHPFWLLIGLGLMGAALALGLIAAQPPAPKPDAAPGDEFSAARAMIVLERLLGDGAPHPVGSEANAGVRDRIVADLTELGYAVETQDTLGCRAVWATCGHVSNIVTRLPGQTDGPAVLLSAHYDSVPAGPGAADDMAGVAAIIEIARILQQEAPLRNPVILLLSDGEEPGLLGAEAFVAEHPWAAEVGVVVNLEASGTSGPSILFETTDQNAWLIEAYRSHAPRPVASSLFDELIAFTSQNTDLTVYEAHGLAGINFAFVDNRAHYHTPLDNLANLDPRTVQHHGDNALAAVRAFAGIDLTAPPAGTDVYVDLAPGLVAQWPEAWTAWIALACLGLLLAVAVRLIRRGQLTIRALLWGLVVLPLGVLVAALLGLAWAMGMSALTGAPVPWYANPWPMRVAVWTVALLSVLLIATLVARRAGFWGLGLGVWLWWTVLTGLIAWLAPGVSVMFLPPAVLGALALAVVGLSPLLAKPWAREGAVLAGVLGASWFWLPFAIGIEASEGGVELAAMIAFAVALAASAIVPFVAWPVSYHRERRWSLAGAALLIVVATGAAVLVPVYSAARPRQLNLLHVEQRQGNEALWLLESGLSPETSAADVPASLRTAGPFAEEPEPVFPWTNRRYLVAPAQATDAAAPTVEVLADDRRANRRVVEVQLRSPRGGDQLSLYIPETAGLQHIVVAGTPYTVDDTRPRNGYQVFHCHAPACDGITLELHVESMDAIDLMIVDTALGVPPSGNDLLAARPDTAVPSSDGDVSLIVDQVTLDAS